MGQGPSEIREEIEETRGRMGETVDALAYKADVPSRVKESISDKTGRLRDQMAGTGSKINESTPSTGDVKEGAQKAVGIAQENPLGLAIGGVALGFLAGMALPSTRIEDQHLGEASDGLIEQAKDAGKEALEHGKQVASDVTQQVSETATETAKESGREHAEQLQSSVQGSDDTGGDGAPGGTTASSGGTSASGGREAAGGSY